MKEKNWDALCASMDISKIELGNYIELKGNLIDSTVLHTGETGDIHIMLIYGMNKI